MVVNNVLNNYKVATSTKKNTSAVSQAQDTSFDDCLTQVVDQKETVSLNDIFQEAADTYGVPVELLKAVGYTESNFRVDATSHCGAQGIMQLMPATAEYLGVTDAYDPKQNIMGGAKYLSQLLKKYEGNTNLALAAYNAGSGNVSKYGGIPPFKETQNYVVKVNKYMNQQLDADVQVQVGSSADSKPVTPYTPVFEEVDEEDIVSTQDKLDVIFSYDDYELLLKVLKQEDEENQEKKEQENSTLAKINMNPSIMNLLRSAEIQNI